MMQMQTIGAARTMSSREIAELTEKNHADVLRDIRNMLEQLGLTASSFAGSYKDSTGRTLPAFDLPEDLTITLVSGYSVQMRHRIVRRWQELEAGAAPVPAATPQSVEAVMFAEAVNRALRLEGSAALGMVRSAIALKAPEYLPLLPVYAIDAPAGAPAVSSAPTESLTSLMARHRVGVSTRAGNLILQERGLLEKRTRPSSSGTAKSFWSVTEKGLAFGKNISSPENPRETQPHWFSARGEELLRLMGVLE